MTTPAHLPLRVGYVPGVILTKWRRIWEERFPDTPLAITPVTEPDARGALLRGDVDACFVRLPVDVDGLHLIRLYDEQPVVWVAKEHAIAAVDEVTLEDLLDEEVLTEVTAVNIDRVVAEVAVLRVPLSVARGESRRDMVHRPVVDAPPTTVGLAWLRDADDVLIQELVGIVRGRSVNSSRTARERETRTTDPTAQKQPQPQKQNQKQNQKQGAKQPRKSGPTPKRGAKPKPKSGRSGR